MKSKAMSSRNSSSFAFFICGQLGSFFKRINFTTLMAVHHSKTAPINITLPGDGAVSLRGRGVFISRCVPGTKATGTAIDQSLHVIIKRFITSIKTEVDRMIPATFTLISSLQRFFMLKILFANSELQVIKDLVFYTAPIKRGWGVAVTRMATLRQEVSNKHTDHSAAHAVQSLIFLSLAALPRATSGMATRNFILFDALANFKSSIRLRPRFLSLFSLGFFAGLCPAFLFDRNLL